jgi:tetratricopeptide (TPR) repeat protein
MPAVIVLVAVLSLPAARVLAQPAPAADAAAPSPAQRQIAQAEKSLARDRSRADTYNYLAMALARRARETADSSFYDRAEAAVATSLRLAPKNFDARKARTWVLLGKHEFEKALELARELNTEMPDDLLVYGFLTDAHAELGHYEEAEKACQWMLDLRPGNIPALTRAAYLRELFGDIEGAIELMTTAHQRTPSTEVEDRAWTLTQLAHLELLAGRVPRAEALLNEALVAFPGYHYALANLAKVRTAQARHAEAADLLQRRHDAAPHPENLFDLAVALERAGRATEAAAAFAKFEAAARREMDGPDNANRELIAYYADHAGKPAEALRIAEQESARRRDVYTLDAYAWALHVNGRHEEARASSLRARAVGVRDPAILEHATIIDAAAGPRARAEIAGVPPPRRD